LYANPLWPLMTQMLGWGLDASGGSDNSSASYAMKGASPTPWVTQPRISASRRASTWATGPQDRQSPGQKAPVQKAAAPAPAAATKSAAPAARQAAPAKAKPPRLLLPAQTTRSKRSRTSRLRTWWRKIHHPARAAQGQKLAGQPLTTIQWYAEQMTTGGMPRRKP